MHMHMFRSARRSYTRQRDPHIVRKLILAHLKEHGPTTYTHLMFAAELNSIHMIKYIQTMADDRLIKVLQITNNNRYKYIEYVSGATRKLITITGKGLNVLEMIEQMPIVDYTSRGLVPSSKP